MNQTQSIRQTQAIAQDLEQKPQIALEQGVQNPNQDVIAMETNATQALSFPKPTGAYVVGTTSLHFVDPEREETFTEDPNDKREIAAKVWYPSEDVPGATTAPYMSEEMSSAFASGLGIPPQEFVNLVQSIPTHSVENAPVAEAESKYPVLFLSHGSTVDKPFHPEK